MHILLGLLVVIAGIGAWYWRFKMAERRKPEALPVETVNDPAAAAVVMMIAVGSAEHPLSPEAEAVIRDEITATMGIADPAEILVFGKRSPCMWTMATVFRCVTPNCGIATLIATSASISFAWRSEWRAPMVIQRRGSCSRSQNCMSALGSSPDVFAAACVIDIDEYEAARR
jgi:hypothetical protein